MKSVYNISRRERKYSSSTNLIIVHIIIIFLKVNENLQNLVGESLSLFVFPLSCWKLLLNKSLANESNFALTRGDFSECSDSEFSELTDRPLKI